MGMGGMVVAGIVGDVGIVGNVGCYPLSPLKTHAPKDTLWRGEPAAGSLHGNLSFFKEKQGEAPWGSKRPLLLLCSL